MANWKKVIVSGSNAELKQITASAGIHLPGIAAGAHSATTTPLVIDSTGKVTTGSAYALAAGGDTVGGSGLTDNVVIIGNGNSAIEAAAGQLLSFEESHLNNISSITMSGDIVFDEESSIHANSGKLHITASSIKSTKLDISGDIDTGLSEGVVFADSNGILKADSGDFKYDGTNKLTITQIENVNSRTHVTSSGNIKAVGYVSGSSVTGSNGLAIGTGTNIRTVAEYTSNQLVLGDASEDVKIQSEKLIINATHGITASVVPTDEPAFTLGQKANGEVVKFPVSSNNNSTDNSIVGVNEGANIDIVGASTTEYVKLVSRILPTEGSRTSFQLSKNVISGSNGKLTQAGANLDQAGLTIDGTSTVKIFNHGNGSEQIIGVTSFDESPSNGSVNVDDDFKFVLDSVLNSDMVGNNKPIDVFLQVTTNTGTPTISLEQDVDIEGSASIAGTLDIHGGGLYFSGSEGDIFQISHSAGSTLNITASNIDVSGHVSASSFDFNAITFSGNDIVQSTGDNQFGDNVLADNHMFSGSVSITGSLNLQANTILSIPGYSDVSSSLNAIQINSASAGASIASINTSVSAQSSLIGTNTSNISTNAADIVTNTAAISANDADIAANTTAISANDADIAANTSAITANASTAATATAAVAATAAANATAISSNDTDIAANTAAITANASTAATATATVAATAAANATAIASATSTADANATAISTLNGQSTTYLPLAGGTMAGNINLSNNNITNGGSIGATSVNTSGNVTVGGDLTVNGQTTILSSTDLQIEDRFILIGSGSAGTGAGYGGSIQKDVGIIFETNRNGGGTALGTALYHDGTDDRINIARGVASNIAGDIPADQIHGHVVSVRATGSAAYKGTLLNNTVNKAGIAGGGDVIFGVGEMVIDQAGTGDIWIYTNSPA